MADGVQPQARGNPPDAAASGGRRDVVDFWRGFVLCTIFVNHVPGNLFERLTFRNFGFSDSSEAFVFISGLSLALAYGRRFATGSMSAVMAGLARRAVKLYALHIALSVAGVAIFAAGAVLTDNSGLMDVHGRDLVVEDPVAALVGLVSLGHQFGYFNILPLYILLVGMAPALFGLARISVPLMLAVSVAVYVLTRLSGLNVPSWPMRGTWFFDPFAWQLLMAIGLAVGLRLRAGFTLNRWLVGAAAAVLAGAAVCTTDGFGAWPGLYDTIRPLADLDKTTLGVGRLAHFLSLACCLQAAGLAEAMRLALWYKPLCLIGQHGLAMFGLLSLMAAVGQVVTDTLGHTPLVDLTVVGCGLAALCGAARLLAARRAATPMLARAVAER